MRGNERAKEKSKSDEQCLELQRIKIGEEKGCADC